ncbi:transposase [Aerosakkonema funiforme]
MTIVALRLNKMQQDRMLKLPSLWTHSYFVSMAGNVSNETSDSYIQNQKY